MFAVMTTSRPSCSVSSFNTVRAWAAPLLGGALVALSTLASAQTAAQAQAGEALARQKACLTCHQVNKAVIGPSFADIAKKYKDDKKAVDRLAAKVRKGGGGVWNMPMGPMPAQGQVSEAEAKQIVAWVLTTK